jgi:hypothetical protein
MLCYSMVQRAGDAMVTPTPVMSVASQAGVRSDHEDFAKVLV